mgnify:FL=1
MTTHVFATPALIDIMNISVELPIASIARIRTDVSVQHLAITHVGTCVPPMTRIMQIHAKHQLEQLTTNKPVVPTSRYSQYLGA